MRRISIVTFMTVSLLSCTFKKTPADYVQYIESEHNGFRKTVAKGEWLFRAQYKPATYIYLQETRSEKPDEGTFHKREHQLKNWLFFNVYIRHNRERNAPLRLLSPTLQHYNVLLNYYLTENKNNFILYTDGDTLYPKMYIYENNYGLSPEDVFVVGFENKAAISLQSMVLQFDDRYFTNGLIRFSFSKQELQKEPQINF